MMQHGFELLRTQELAELKARAHLFRHVKTGAELLSIEVDDENKVFGITFRTPPRDHTGVAHILEHSVLCGSRRYPTKEPFVELLKGSLQTFLNAFTYPDKTCYPVASQNRQDFYNLINVYLDAVFYPLLTRHTHEQEGWHYELENVADPLSYKGVVFNEMKGVYSSPDSLLVECAQRSLFPDTVYGVDSGGDPAHIPDLTYEQLTGFHRQFYHPSNARVYFYGDDDPTRRLQLMDEWLSAFAPANIDSQVALQPAFPAPRRLEQGYRVDEDAESAKAFVAVNWLLPSPVDVDAALLLQILGHILIGTPASPLRKALIDSGLGEDLAGVGLETHARQMYFSTGLRGVAQDQVDRVEPLIEGTLQRLAAEGVDPRTVEASLNTVEFGLRENNTGSYPRGLVVMLRALTSWLYDGDPLAPLTFEARFQALRARLAAGERVFEELIDRHFLRNTHRTTLYLRPDAQVGPQQEAREQAALAAARANMSPADLEALVAHTAELKRLQAEPDAPAALAAIPSLKREDLAPANKLIPLQKITREGARLLYHDLFTNGILYFDVGLNLRHLPPELVPYVPLLGRALLETGTGKEDFVSLSQRIGSKTGGIAPQTFTSVVRDTATGTCWLFLRGKAMEHQAEELLEILREVLEGARLDLRARVKQIALEEKAALEAGLVPAGHVYVGHRLRAGFDEANWAAEQMRGVSYLQFLRKLTKDIDADWAGVANALDRTREILLNRRSMIFNATLDSAAWSRLETRVQQFIQDLPARPSKPAEWPAATTVEPEGLAIPAQVNYVGKSLSLQEAGHAFDGTALVATRYLRSAYLWEKVRVMGGAYGGFCYLDHRAELINFVSYRDPNLAATLAIYDQAADYLAGLDLSADELTKSIIGAIGDLDQHLLPDAKGYASLCRYLANDPDDFRQRMREQILATTVADFRRFGEALRALARHGRVVVMGSQEALAAHGGLAITRVL
jgi:Zn-dependent M16 (insulinase) family peptidase